MSTPRLLSNRYELGETSYGGMSEVHRGRDVRLGRDVAVKVLRADLARDPQFRERFRREAQNAAALNHPAIVAVYDTGETPTDDGTSLPYIVMEWVEGRTLRDIVKTQGPLTSKRAMEVMADVCAALDFSHRHGIIHRDVKPANVMITKTGAVKVMDFGIARAVADGQAAMTQTAAVIGTAQYLSPEQAKGETVDARSDVYAAGCVLFELLTGEPPFTGDSPVAVAYQHVREDPPPPSSLNPQVSPALDAIVLKAMAKGPANRYQSAAEMRADLVRVLAGQRPSAPAVMTDEDRTSILGAGQVPGNTDQPAVYDDAYEEDERRRRRKRAIIISSIVLGIILLAVLATWLISGAMGESNTTAAIPNVLNMRQQDAIRTLNDKGFGTITTDTSTPCQPSTDGSPPPCTADQIGKVFAQSPDANTVVDKNTKITLRIGVAPGKVTIPDEKGKSIQDATADLTSKNLIVSPTTTQESVDDNNLVGKVSSTNPAAGTSVSAGSTVTLNIGKAPDLTPVPDVRGQPFDVASANLTNAGFKVTEQLVSSPQPANTVVNQNPAGGGKAKPGTTFVLQVSKGDQLTMPNIVGQTKSQAQATLEQLGWTGSFATSSVPTNNQSQNGTIAQSNPSAGAGVDKNGTITIQVYQYSVIPTSTTSP